MSTLDKDTAFVSVIVNEHGIVFVKTVENASIWNCSLAVISYD